MQRMFRASSSLAARIVTSSLPQCGELVSVFRSLSIPSSVPVTNTFGPVPIGAASLALRDFRKSFHVAPWVLDSNGQQQQQQQPPTLNPLQQAPSPGPNSLPSIDSSSSAGPGKAFAIARNISISPRKLNMFAKVLRGLRVDDALIQCQMHPKKSASICQKVLLSAKANAVHNHGLLGDSLLVDEAWVGKGTHLKRTALHGRGRSGKMMKYRSHLTVVLREVNLPPRKTRVIPMVLERQKWWGMREGHGEGESSLLRSWWPKKSVPPGAMRGRKARGEGEGKAA